jgi:ankyrin repeat protein
MSDLFEEIVTLLYYEADLSEVRSRVETNPLVVLEQSSFGSTLLHVAAIYCTSPEYCRMLLEFDPNHESLRMPNNKGELPLYTECKKWHLEAAEFLLNMHPETINVLTSNDSNCLHALLFGANSSDDIRSDEQIVEFARLLLNCAPGIISATTEGDLALHIACQYGLDLPVIEFLYNSWPAAISVTMMEIPHWVLLANGGKNCLL